MPARNVNMLSGPLYRELLAFSLPIAVTGILEQLFNATDRSEEHTSELESLA